MQYQSFSTHCLKVISKVKVSVRRTEWQNDGMTELQNDRQDKINMTADLRSRGHKKKLISNYQAVIIHDTGFDIFLPKDILRKLPNNYKSNFQGSLKCKICIEITCTVISRASNSKAKWNQREELGWSKHDFQNLQLSIFEKGLRITKSPLQTLDSDANISDD